MTIEGELENLCAGNMELISKRANIRCNQPQVLGDELQTAQFCSYSSEELRARARYPTPGSGRRCSGRDMPGCGKSAKMVQADHQTWTSRARKRSTHQR